MMGVDMADDHDINLRVKQFLVKRFPQVEGRGIADDEPLLETGILDSLGVLDLVGFLEQEFVCEIDDEELLPENFESINRIADFVLRKCPNTPSPLIEP